MRHLLTALILLSGALVSAQATSPGPDRAIKRPMTNAHMPQEPTTPRAATPALWTEDFEDGLSGWAVNTTAGAVSWQLTSTGNTGGYTPGPLQSTTGHPGGNWIVADSDLQGTAGISETTTITSPPITGLDTVGFMLLHFEQSFRQLNDDETTVEVSGNGGLTWTSYPVNDRLPGNQSTPYAPGAQTVVLNISAALNGGASDIRIRFRWHSDQGYTYSWQVDDLSLHAAHTNDLTLQGTTWSVWDLSEPDFRNLPYTVYPANEVRPLTFRGRITNNGSTTQTNARLQVTIDGPWSNDIVLTSTSADLDPLETDSFFITTYQPPGVSGHYAITMTAVQDQAEDDAFDNSIAHAFAVDPFVFARDLGQMDGDIAKGSDAYLIGNWFHMDAPNNSLTAVQVAFSDRSDPGAMVTVGLYDDNLDQLQESEEYFLQAPDLNAPGGNTFVTIPLSSPALLLPNTDYFVAVEHYGGPLEVWTGLSGESAEQTSLIYDGGLADWFYTRSTPMVRMTFDPTASVADPASAGMEAVALPTVFDASTVIRFTLKDASPMRIQLTDMSGRVLSDRSLGVLAPGRHEVDIDGGGLAPGAYVATLFRGTERTTVRIIRAATE